MIKEISSQPDSIPKDFYQAKKLVSKLGLKEEKINCCLKGCMLYYKEDDTALIHCKFCEGPKFKPSKWKMGSTRMLTPKGCLTPHMKWHAENKKNDAVTTHRSHGEDWQHYVKRLGLSLIPSRIVIDTNIPPTLVSASKEVDIIQPLDYHSERTIKGIKDEEEQLEDDVQSKSDEECPELLD